MLPDLRSNTAIAIYPCSSHSTSQIECPLYSIQKKKLPSDNFLSTFFKIHPSFLSSYKLLLKFHHAFEKDGLYLKPLINKSTHINFIGYSETEVHLHMNLLAIQNSHHTNYNSIFTCLKGHWH